MTEPNRLGELVGGKYRIVRFLAAGGMGSVYEAQHTLVRRRFAVKFLRHELAVRRELLTRFQREAEAAGALESDNVARAMDFGIAEDGAPYIVLEYLEGESLEHLLEREGKLPVERATNLLVQACRGVQAAHAAGIVHRDLKPHNLFLCRKEDGTDLVKVLDFGVAKLEMLEQGVAATRTGTVLGTPSYMSPEQARGEKQIDHASDVYALGAILFELLSGKKPHPGDSHNAILHHIATQPPLSLGAAEPELPLELVAVIERALAPDRAARYTSAEELARALAPWSRAEVWPAPKLEPSAPRHEETSSTLLAPQSPVALLSSAVDGAARGAEQSLAVSAVERRRPLALVSERSGALVLGGAVVMLVAVLVLVLGRGSQPPAAAGAPSPELTEAKAPPNAPSSPALAEPPQVVTPPAGTLQEGVARPRDEHPSATAAAKPETAEPSAGPVHAAAVRAPTAPAGRVMPPPTAAERTAGRPAGRPQTPAAEATRPESEPAEPRGVAPVTFDQHNPYQ